MNDLQRSLKSEHPPIESRLSSLQTGRKAATCFLAVMIVSVMVVWFGFLGWGFISILQWLLDCIKSFWVPYL
jgi:hypothetical protein